MSMKFGDGSSKDLGDIRGQISCFSDYSHHTHTYTHTYRYRDGIYNVYIASRADQTIRGRMLSEGSLDLESIGGCHKIHQKNL